MYNRSSKYLYHLIYTDYLSLIFLEDCEIEFKNLYLGNNCNIHYDENTSLILLLFKCSDVTSSTFNLFFNNIKQHKFYEDYYIIDDTHFMIILNVGQKEQEVIKLFKEGKFSKFPNWYKQEFTSNNNIKCAYNVITKNPYLKKKIEKELDVVLSDEAELDSIPIKEQEEFDMLQIIELYNEE